ncbi:MAG: hypothetical protein HBSAPP03_07670 [Phycisphaerae bacterium]|nr:MAG: hypothetical protein HBSAPP03_07670 [Phycisphaerae bacterium]
MSTGRRYRQDAEWKAKDAYERWRGLSKSTRWMVALVSLGVAAVALGTSAYFVFLHKGGGHDVDAPGEVVLYTSTDAHLVGPIVGAFEAASGVKVRVVGDTEATKTTGLVERLVREKDAPRADVWWSNEAMGTVALARAGVLEPFASREEGKMPGGWPAHLRGADRTWYGFAQRARVIAYNTNRVAESNAPRTLRDLTNARWAGKVGLARPQFGTTRTHIAALVAMHGSEATAAWLAALKDNAVRLYDGNSSVVQALSVGEIEVGLTDTDDVFSARANTWPVAFVFESVDKPTAKVQGLPSLGPVVIPNTVGLVRGSPHPVEARRLADFLLSEEVERLLAASDSRNVPIRPALAKELAVPTLDAAAPATPEQCAAAMEEADRLIARYFPL